MVFRPGSRGGCRARSGPAEAYCAAQWQLFNKLSFKAFRKVHGQSKRTDWRTEHNRCELIVGKNSA